MDNPQVLRNEIAGLKRRVEELERQVEQIVSGLVAASNPGPHGTESASILDPEPQNPGG